MKRILGLDLGTNSIGWAIVERDDKDGRILKSGSRIIPMDAGELSDFAKGNTKSQTADRTMKRSARRMRERFILRRERLHRILKELRFLPEHYFKCIGWDLEHDANHYGTFLEGEEPKIAWRKNANGKYEFLFEDSFKEMVSEFKHHHPELSENKKIPYDWTIYFLRKKALTQKISKEELAWIILNFNQKRGYNQLRDEVLETTADHKKEEFMRLTVKSVTPDDTSKGKDTWYEIRFENSDIIYRRKSRFPLDWIGKKRNLIITTKLDHDGKPKLKKDGSVDYSVKSPNDDDWAVLKIRTEQDLKASKQTVGQYIYATMLAHPSEKIRGGLVRTIERKFYKDELRMILDKQKEFHPELIDSKLYSQCIHNLYKNNEAHRNNISQNDFTYLILEDVIFYQRPLKSKKSLVDDCPYESHQGIDKETGEIRTYPVKCIAKSNPYFQEYRIWKFISDLRIIANTKIVNGHIQSDIDVTSDFFTSDEDWCKLFMWLNDKGNIEQSELLSHLGIKKKEQSQYRWNYVEDKKYPMNATRHALISKMESSEILSRETEQALWQLLYSTKSKEEIDKSLAPSHNDNGIYSKLLNAGISQKTIESFKSIKLPDEGYGAYSEKAIKKLLPLMRRGSMWSEANIDAFTLSRIHRYISGEGMENFSANVKKQISTLYTLSSYKGLPEWLACYIVYGRNSEMSNVAKWNHPHDINVYLNNFKQHSFRNPIVENVILETLRVVRDLWLHYGSFDEIHIEMGRDLKNPSEKRARLTQRALENENTNIRIKTLLAEFVSDIYAVDNVRAYSPSQQDLLRIYEEGVLAKYEPDEDIQDIITKLSNPSNQPTRSQILRYKCWLDQKYCSPYTGQPIPLSRLFTSDYEIEHIIPQSRYFDDSFANKVICEAEVNKLKDNMLGYEFIKQHHGQTVKLASGKSVRILEVSNYEQHVKDTYPSTNVAQKRRNLLLDEIPSDFIKRQLNDSRYISKVVKNLLSNIVREVDEDGYIEKEAISKNIITCNGSVTSRLKRDWGLGEVWNDIVLPRFQRLNRLTGKTCFTTFNTHGQEIPHMPLEMQRGFKIKRIDHRHHALDAIVIACTTREHVNLLSNEASIPENRSMYHALSHKIRRCEEVIINGKKQTVYKEFLMPWTSFKTDTRKSLEQIVISFKQNLRVVNQATNFFTKYVDGHKASISQQSEEHFAIRKPLHKETIYGHVNLRKIGTAKLKDALKDIIRIVDKRLRQKVQELKALHYDEKQILTYFKTFAHEWKGYDFLKIPVFYFTDEKEKLAATRYGNDLVSIFSKKKKKQDIEKIIAQITDTGIQKILTNYLNENLDNIEFAFSAEGLELMNDNIIRYNNGKLHKPIYKVRMVETMGQKFQIGQTGNKKKKYVEAAKGTNLFFAVYMNEDEVRSYSTIPLNVVIERMKQRLSPVPETNDNGDKLLFYLSPGDLVYVPAEESNLQDNDINPHRIYKFVSCTSNEAHLVPAFIASPILQTIELGSNNKSQRSWTGEMIKEVCYPLAITRIGEVKRK